MNAHEGQSDDGTSGWQATTIDDETARENPQAAQDVAEIARLRQSIDNIDMAITSLLAERFKCTAQVGRLKARAGFAPEDREREARQAARQRQIAIETGLDPKIAETYREFVAAEAKRRHQRILDEVGDAGVPDV